MRTPKIEISPALHDSLARATQAIGLAASRAVAANLERAMADARWPASDAITRMVEHMAVGATINRLADDMRDVAELDDARQE